MLLKSGVSCGSFSVNVRLSLCIVTPHTQCRLKLLKQERIKDYLLMEEEFIRNQEQMKPLEEKQEVHHLSFFSFTLFLLFCTDISVFSLLRRRGQRSMTSGGHQCLWGPWRRSLMTIMPLSPRLWARSIMSAFFRLLTKICWSPAVPSCSITR